MSSEVRLSKTLGSTESFLHEWSCKYPSTAKSKPATVPQYSAFRSELHAYSFESPSNVNEYI